MTGGKILDSGALSALARHANDALHVLDQAERTATTLFVAATSLADACLGADGYEAALLGEIADFGVVLVDPLTRKNADQAVARIPLELPADCDPGSVFALQVGHARLIARDRGWPVVTTRPDVWSAVPGIGVEPIDPA